MAEQDRDRTDLELLRQYANGGSAAAFAELVGRHVDLVYSAALRQVRDRHHAEDVTQATFIVLARRAPSIRDGVVVAGWLLNAARYCSRDLLKREARRRRHEDHAARERMSERMHDMSGSSNTHAAENDLPDDEESRQLRAVLDGAMSKLGDAGRDAIVLRFFQQKSFREVGAALGISEEAAKQRVFRALQRLRGVMEKRGVAVSAAGLGTFLGANAVHAAPAGLAALTAATAVKVAAGAAVAGAAGATTAASTSTPMTLAKGAVTLMTWTTKAKAAAAAALAILLLGGTAVTVRHWSHGGDEVAIPAGQAKAAAAVGLRPVQVYWPGGAAPQPYKAGVPITGVVHNADGSPAANAEVLLANQAANVAIYERSANGSENTRTGADGKFSITPHNQPNGVVIRADNGYAVAPIIDPAKPLDLTLKPWGRIEGTVRSGSKPVPRAKVYLVHFEQEGDAAKVPVLYQKQYTADAEGKFVIEHVVPGNSQVARMNDNVGWMGWEPIRVKAGETTKVQVGGVGRPVIGKAGPMDGSYNFRRGYINEQRDNWKQSDPQPRQITFEVAPDGTFRADDVPPGKYQLNLQLGVIEPGSGYVEDAANGWKTVTMPDVPGGQSDEPLDVGSISLTVNKRLHVGDQVPDFAMVTADGKPLHMSEVRGKVTLVQLWDSRRNDTTQEFTALKAVYDWYGDDPRFAMLSVRIDGSASPAAMSTTQPSAEALISAFKTFAGTPDAKLPNAGLTWPQAGVPAGATAPAVEQVVPREYFASPSLMFLIDADGRLIAKNFNGIAAYTLIERALAPQPVAGKLFP